MKYKYKLIIRINSLIGKADVLEYDFYNLHDCISIIENHKKLKNLKPLKDGQMYEFSIYHMD